MGITAPPFQSAQDVLSEWFWESVGDTTDDGSELDRANDELYAIDLRGLDAEGVKQAVTEALSNTAFDAMDADDEVAAKVIAARDAHPEQGAPPA